MRLINDAMSYRQSAPLSADQPGEKNKIKIQSNQAHRDKHVNTPTHHFHLDDHKYDCFSLILLLR